MTATATIARTWLTALRPPPRLSISQWADQHRRLPETSAARGGRWRNETAPYLVAIMNAVLEPGVRQIALVKSAQSGGSEAIANILAYHVEHRPCPLLVVMPTANAARAWHKERWQDLVRSTPALRTRVSTSRVTDVDGRPASTLELTMFPGGFLAIGGGNSPNSFARWSTRIAVADDCDRIPRIVGVEGDPTELLRNRTTTYHDGVVIFVSTPVLAGGRIEALFAQSDQRRFCLPCPACGRVTWVTWGNRHHWHVVFDERTPSSARLACPCGHAVRESGRMALVRQGCWMPTAASIAAGYVGFHLPAMLSPFVTLEDLTARFLRAHHGGPRRLREFVTTQLAEGWRDETARVEVSSLAARLEDF